ncbi:MAG TPA: DUF885 family protein [Clostridia bacterium]|nr:DUF885 family protein [Clostridia bacterium]
MQKSKIRVLSLVLVLALIIATLTGCHSFAGYGSEQFDSYCDQLVYYMLNGDALSVNFLLSEPSTFGLENSTATLYVPTLVESDYYNSYSAYGDLSNDLTQFNYSALSDQQKTTWQMLTNAFSETTKKKDFFYLQSGYLGSVSGTNCNLPVELAEYKFAKVLDVQNYLSLLDQSENAFKSYCDYEKIRIDNGYGRAGNIYQGIVDQCNGFAPTGKDNENFLVANFNTKIDNCSFLTDTEKADFKAQNLNLLTTKLLPAYRATAQTVATYVGNPSNNSLGLAKYEGGADYYQVIFNSKTSTSDTISQAYNNLIGFYNKISTAREALKLSYNGKYGEENLDADKMSFYTNQNTEPATLKGLISNLENSIKDDFPLLPDTIPEATFNYVDESLGDFYSPAAYFLSSADSLSSPEIIYINKYSDSEYNTFELLSHEGYPGHLLQNAYFKSTGAHPVRRLFGFTGYSEGWGNYAQFYTAKYFSDNERMSLAYQIYLQDKIISGITVSLIDILVNGLAKDVTDVKNFMYGQEHIPTEEEQNSVQGLVDFVVENPANYPAYYYGYYKLCSLKDEYQRIWSSSYSDLQFHKAILSAGPMTFEQLKDILFK